MLSVRVSERPPWFTLLCSDWLTAVNQTSREKTKQQLSSIWVKNHSECHRSSKGHIAGTLYHHHLTAFNAYRVAQREKNILKHINVTYAEYRGSLDWSCLKGLTVYLQEGKNELVNQIGKYSVLQLQRIHQIWWRAGRSCVNPALLMTVYIYVYVEVNDHWQNLVSTGRGRGGSLKFEVCLIGVPVKSVEVILLQDVFDHCSHFRWGSPGIQRAWLTVSYWEMQKNKKQSQNKAK